MSAGEMRERTDFDVAIVGGGLVGLALAAALARSGLAIALFDRGPLVVDHPASAGDDWDSRVYAVSPGSASFLHAIGAWSRLDPERIAAIESMQVRGDDGGSLEFSAYEAGERALAWIVEHRALAAPLVRLVRCCSNALDVRAPAALRALVWRDDRVVLETDDGSRASARLVVGADGLHSWTRAQAGVPGQALSYDQRAIVANFRVEVAHRGCAFQWFFDDGSVLAWLPLPGERVSIVWSARDALAEELLALEPADFEARVAAGGRGELGAMSLLGARAAYPLSHLALDSVVAPRLALVGDAAHGVHPLAGQGMNLGFGDVAALARILVERGPISDVGSALLLRRYASRRRASVAAMHATTHGLTRLFATRGRVVRRLRNAGLSLIDALPPIRRALAQPALR